MTRVALDSSVLVAWIRQEHGWQAVDELLRRSDVHVIAPGPVLTEVIVRARRQGNASSGQEFRDVLGALDVEIAPAVDVDLVRAAELLEASRGKRSADAALSLGDALILAICERLGVPVLTRDRVWSQLEASGTTTARVVQL
jgi:PIN domain nuclease of toxin-antitoxin system